MKNIIANQVDYVPRHVTSHTYYPIIITPGENNFTVLNDGTAAAPCRLSLTTINDIMELTVTGLSEEPLKINNIMAGSLVIFDGINKQVTVNGLDALDRFNGWEFPKLQPGANEITITAASEMTLIEIEFQPRFI